MVKKIVVFTGNLSHSVRRGIIEIDNSTKDILWLILIHSPKKRLSKIVRSQWVNLCKNGWRWIPYQASDLISRVMQKWKSEHETNSETYHPFSRQLADQENIQILRVSDINSSTACVAASNFSPDLGLSLAAPILKSEIFALPTLGTLNLHKGKLPDYRGMPPAFWETWNGEKSVGCSIHWVDETLDSGDIATEEALEIGRFSTVKGLQLQLDNIGIRLMENAVKDVFSGNLCRRRQDGHGRVFKKPTLAQISRLRNMELSQQPKSTIPFIRTLKSARSASGLFASKIGLLQALPPRITVLLYHRVTDDSRDNLTVGIEQFNRHMAILRKHCTILTIQEILTTRIIPSSRRPLVAVTFDDGYYDNFANAAPIMMRHDVPGAFFVSTGIVNSENSFPHDIKRKNPNIRKMTWDDLRTMKNWGFYIGSHSVNHIDCAGESAENVANELNQSKLDLARELGLQDMIFAYPYGGKQHMTPDRLELVKEAGYIGCLSAFGGSNIGQVDRYNVLRRGIHWEYSDADFMYQCLGL